MNTFESKYVKEILVSDSLVKEDAPNDTFTVNFMGVEFTYSIRVLRRDNGRTSVEVRGVDTDEKAEALSKIMDKVLLAMLFAKLGQDAPESVDVGGHSAVSVVPDSVNFNATALGLKL